MTVKNIFELGPIIIMELINIKGYKGKLARSTEVKLLNKNLSSRINSELDQQHGNDLIKVVHEIKTMFNFTPAEFYPYYCYWQLVN